MKKGKPARIRVDLETGEGLIIQRDSLLSSIRNTGKLCWGALSWLLWLDLLRPLLLAAFWIVGARLASYQVLHREGMANADFFVGYGLVIVGIFIALFLWNRYNYHKFRGTDRRRPRGDCAPGELAKFYGIRPRDAAHLDGRDIEISFHPDRSIAIRTETGRTIAALYAPQQIDLHFAKLREDSEEEELLEA